MTPRSTRNPCTMDKAHRWITIALIVLTVCRFSSACNSSPAVRSVTPPKKEPSSRQSDSVGETQIGGDGVVSDRDEVVIDSTDEAVAQVTDKGNDVTDAVSRTGSDVGRTGSDVDSSGSGSAGRRRCGIRRGAVDAAESTKINKFGFEFVKEVVDVAGVEGNQFLSPLSIYMALMMTSLGANGTTLEEMQRVLRSTSPGGESPPCAECSVTPGFLAGVMRRLTSSQRCNKVKIANRLFANEEVRVKPDFKMETKKFFEASLQNVDMGKSVETADVINKWITAETEGLIKDVISTSDITPLTLLLLVNTIYFKGEWNQTFTTKKYYPVNFRPLSGPDISDMPHMRTKGYFHYSLDPDRLWHAASIPYKHSEVEMVIVMPKSTRTFRQDFATLSDQINSETSSVRNLLNARFPGGRKKMNIMMPKFKLRVKTDGIPVLQRMGMQDLFREGTADLSQMTDADAYISKVMHQAFVEVDEVGTRAGAATVVVSSGRSMEWPEPIHFYVNMPFFFFIRDRLTNLILFSGKVTDPTREA